MEWLILLVLVMVVVGAVVVLAGSAARAGRDTPGDLSGVGPSGPRHYDQGAGGLSTDADTDGDGGV